MPYEPEAITMKEYKELPYTVVGHTSLLDSFSYTLKAGGLKKLIENCHDEDLIQFTTSTKGTEFRIHKWKEHNVDAPRG